MPEVKDKAVFKDIKAWSYTISESSGYAYVAIMTIMLAVTFESSFGDKFMYQHARKAPDEMRELHKQFYAYMKKLKETRYEILWKWRQ